MGCLRSVSSHTKLRLDLEFTRSIFKLEPAPSSNNAILSDPQGMLAYWELDQFTIIALMAVIGDQSNVKKIKTIKIHAS